MVATKGLFACAIVAVVCAIPALRDQNDQQTLENIWDCVKPKMPAGIPEIDFPSFNPYLQPFNLTFGVEFIVYKYFFIVDNVRFYGLPEANVTFTQLSKNNDNVASFEFSVQWPSLFIDAFWDKIVDFNGTDVTTHGLMNMTLTDTFLKGTLKIEKPILSGNITELNIKQNGVKNVEVGVTNMGELEDFVFSKLFKYVWKFIIGSHLLGKVLQNSLQKNLQALLDNPDNLKVLLSGCDIDSQ